MAKWVRYPLPLFSAFPPWRACEVEVGYPPPQKRGISAILARYPMKTRQKRAIPPLRHHLERGTAGYGWVSRTGPLSFQVLKNFGEAYKTMEKQAFHINTLFLQNQGFYEFIFSGWTVFL